MLSYFLGPPLTQLDSLHAEIENLHRACLQSTQNGKSAFLNNRKKINRAFFMLNNLSSKNKLKQIDIESIMPKILAEITEITSNAPDPTIISALDNIKKEVRQHLAHGQQIVKWQDKLNDIKESKVTTNVDNAQASNEIALLKDPIVELFQSEITFLSCMDELENELKVMPSQHQTSKTHEVQKLLATFNSTAYKHGPNKVLEEIHAITSIQDLETTIQTINDYFQTPYYTQYNQDMNSIIMFQTNNLAMLTKLDYTNKATPFRGRGAGIESFHSLVSTAAQRAPRYQLLMSDIQSQVDKINKLDPAPSASQLPLKASVSNTYMVIRQRLHKGNFRTAIMEHIETLQSTFNRKSISLFFNSDKLKQRKKLLKTFEMSVKEIDKALGAVYISHR